MGVIVVCAAGNNATNLDYAPYYPVSFPLDNIIGVASILPDNTLAGSSNYEIGAVDVATYGTFIRSTWPNNNYAALSCTSMAAPFVSGKMSLLDGSISERTFALYASVTKTTYLSDKVTSGGFLKVNTEFLSSATTTVSPVVTTVPLKATIARAGLYSVSGYVNKPIAIKVYVNNRLIGQATVVYNNEYNRYDFSKVLGRRYFHRGWNIVSIRRGDSNIVLSSKLVRRII